jgi:micrococcal nuclease
VLTVAVRAACDFYVRDDTARLDEPLPEGWYDVDRVVDGDTIRVFHTPAGEDSPKSIRVRLIGINAPEVARQDKPAQPYAAEATEFSRNFLSGKKAYLRFGPRRLDQHNRVLAYVFVDDAMLNEEIVREGLARETHFTGDDHSVARRIQKAQLEAKRAGRGGWSGNPGW